MNISVVKTCTGCFACLNICPKHCISITDDIIHHHYPKVDENVCVDCQLCVKVCPEIQKPKLQVPMLTYAAWRNNEEEKKKSSSGGLAFILSQRFIETGGVVYGASFIKPFGFEHVRCTTVADLDALRGSKYVQSDIINVYSLIKKDLACGIKILFIGTPCQVAAIKSFFKDNSKIFTIDILCHGVPSVELFKESFPENIISRHVDNVIFRDNTKYHVSAKRGISTIYERPLYNDYYMKGFFKALYYRESCYKCQYATDKRLGDLTLGDFWGVNLNAIHKKKEDGISLVIINSRDGNSLLGTVKNEITFYERPLSEAKIGNKQLNHPTKKTLRSRIFRYLYPQLGLYKAIVISIPEIYVKNKIFHK